MKYLFNTAPAVTLRFIYDGPRNNPDPAPEAAAEEAERATVHAECREDCEELAVEVKDGLAVTDGETAPVILAEADTEPGDETVIGQSGEDEIDEPVTDTEEEDPDSEAEPETAEDPSPQALHINSLREQPEYETVSDEEFAETQAAVLAKLESGDLEIPEDIADDPEAVNQWLEEQFDIELEGHEANPEDRVDEYIAGQGTDVTPAQRQTYVQAIEQARTANPDVDPNTLMGLIINLLREMGIISEDDNGLLLDSTEYGTYSGPSARAGNDGRPYNGEVYEGGFGLNDSFYNVEALRSQLSPALQEQADEAITKFPEEWHGAIYRNATNNPQFKADQPILLHNISTSTAALWLPGQDQAALHPATHGYGGVGNVNGGGACSIGSFRLRDMPDGGKFQARMGMEGLERKVENYQSRDVQDAFGVDPAAIGNSNADNRLERVHEIRGSRTAGCTGLPLAIADQLDTALARSGGGMMERFVSNPS